MTRMISCRLAHRLFNCARVFRPGEIDDDTTVLQARSAEVQDERPLEARCPQVVDCLRLLDASKQLQRFDLGDHFIEADEVRSVRCGEDLAPVRNRKRYFSAKRDSAAAKLDGISGRVDRFKKTAAQSVMHFKGGTDQAQAIT
jgi:hypothetical protein